MLKFLAALPRRQKQMIMIVTDFIALPVALWAAFALRLSTWAPLDIIPQGKWLLVFVPLVALPIFIPLGLYRTVVRYADERATGVIVYGVTLAVLALALFVVMMGITGIPRSSIVIFWFLAVTFVSLSRSIARRVVRTIERRSFVEKRQRIAIYGAGKAGAQLAMALSSSPEFQVLAFFDDNSDVQGTVLFGVRVYSPERAEKVISDFGLQGLILAMPSASRGRRREIIERFEIFGLSLKTIPGMAELVGGEVRVEDLREVGVEDLLGRDAIPPDERLLTLNIEGRVVLVTGAGGSIGSELCHQIIQRKPAKLILFEISEYGLYHIEQELKGYCLPVEIVAVLGDVKDALHLESVLQEQGVQTLYHAAAYKHVPIVEWNICSGVENNVFGTVSAARAAAKSRVDTFVLISTDKAVRPTNAMGASKRLAELVLQAMAVSQPDTRFCMVRFGNVLGSSGSVVPLFKEQIRRGGPVTVTHPEVTRYFMTIPEAAQLVLQAGSMGQGGDVFVLDMGESVKIIDLAKRMIQLSGLTVKDEKAPDGDIEIQFVGLRPGEKLYEELLIGDNVSGTSHPQILRAEERSIEWSTLSRMLDRLENLCRSQKKDGVRSILMEIVEEYQPAVALRPIGPGGQSS